MHNTMTHHYVRSRLSLSLLIVVVSLASALIGCGAPQRSNSVDFLWTSGKGRRSTQGTSRAKVSISPNSDRRVRIAVVEDRAMQTGQMMRASVWVAATQAALAVDADLSRWRTMVELDTNGMRVDGPSAGALLTASMMAALRGLPVKATVTMTGTVNPDGTVGPVGGIPQKLRAAAAVGKKIIGYPTGQQFSRDHRSGRMVDLQKLAAKLGIKAVEVDDLYEAFELLTGERIVRPAALSKAQMSLPATVESAVQNRAQAWIRGTAKIYRGYIKALGPKGKKGRWLRKALTHLESAKSFLNEGSPAAAYRDAQHAFLWADRAALLKTYVRATSKGRLQNVEKMYGRARKNVLGKMAKLYVSLRKAKPRNEGDVASLTNAFEAANQAMRAMRDADFEYKIAHRHWSKASKGALNDKELMRFRVKLYQPLAKIASCNLHTGESKHHLRFRDKRGKTERILAEDIDHLADGLRGAALANLAYFEATVIKPFADAKGLSLAAMKTRWKGRTYRNAMMAGQIRRDNGKVLKPGSLPHAVAELATALHIYHAGAALVARHYSIKLKGKPGAFVKVGRRKAFRTMLETAELAARQHAARALRITGAVPVASKLAYQLGRDIRDSSSLTDKFAALRAFWSASLHSRLVVMLHRIRSNRSTPS